MLNVGEHAKSAKEKLQNCNIILKKIAGSDRGDEQKRHPQDEAISRNVLIYGALFWAPTIAIQIGTPGNATKHCSSHNY